MKVALISLSKEGARLVGRLAETLPEASVYLHDSVGGAAEAARFDSIVALTSDIFCRYDGLVYVAPCGVAVRALAACVRHKATDPAVVVVDVGGRFAVSLLGGHEGGANDLAFAVANAVGAEPVVTTTTEALKTVIVGVGCRRRTESERIVHAVREALREAHVGLDQVRLLASADIKAGEEGLLRAAGELGVPLRFVPSEDIRSVAKDVERSAFVEERVGLPAVAEPAALAAGRRTRLILPRRVFNGVAVAVARESSL